MAITAKVKLLEDEIVGRINGARSRQDRYRRGALMFALSTTALSAATTVVIGLGQIREEKAWSICALCFSGLIAVLAAWDSLINHRQLWLQTNATLMQLYDLQSDLRFLKVGKEGELTEDEFVELYKRYKTILADANRGWDGVKRAILQVPKAESGDAADRGRM